MLMKVGHATKWKCLDCKHVFASVGVGKPTRCPKRGCRAAADRYKQPYRGQPHKDGRPARPRPKPPRVQKPIVRGDLNVRLPGSMPT